MQVLSATVKFAAGKVFTGQYGERQSVKLTLDSGEDIDIWFAAGNPDYCDLERGDRVRAIYDPKKGKYVVAFEPEPPATPQATPAALSSQPPVEPGHEIEGVYTFSDRKRSEIYTELCRRALVLRSCHVQIQQAFSTPNSECMISEETIQKYATTLYLDMAKY